MVKPSLDAVIHETVPNKNPMGSVIWMHGLGANGYDFLDTIPLLGLSPEENIRFIFPHAPVLSVTANAGMTMPAWYDIQSWDLGAVPDITGMLRSVSQITELIAHEQTQGINLGKILLIGFSQGGVVALLTALLGQYTIGGVAGLSTYLPQHPEVETRIKALQLHRQTLSIWMAHGMLDPIVPYFIGEKSRDYVKQIGFAPAWYTYPMAHMICQPEMATLGAWINQRLG